MSDPIRSISQNNYLLATQQAVSHDNTLTGDGTVESPLSVANPIDETVLWENSAGTTSTVTLSGSAYDYNELDIYASTKNTGTNIVPGPTIHRFSMINNPTRLCDGSSMVQSNGVNVAPMGFNLSSGSISLPSLTNGSAQTVIFKVVGINRR